MLSIKLRPWTMDRVWFFFTLVLFIVHYARPQTLVPGVEVIKPFFLLALLVGAFVLVFRVSGDLLTLKAPQIRYIWLLLLWLLILIPITPGIKKAIDAWMLLLVFMPFVLSVVALTTTVERLKVLIDTTIYVAGYLAFRGLFIAHVGYAKGASFELGNFLSDPNDCSLYMNMMLPFCVYRMMCERAMVKKLLFLVISLLVFSTIIISLSRGGFLGLIATAGIMFYFSPHKKMFAVVGVIVGMLTVVAAGPTFTETMSTSVDVTESTADKRLVLWEASIKAWIHRPWGLGLNGLGSEIRKYADDGDKSWGFVNHSTWLTSLAEWGIIGFGLYFMILKANVKNLLALVNTMDDIFIKYMSISALCSLVAYMAAGTFITANYYPHFWYLTALICAINYIGMTRRPYEQHLA